MIKVKVNKNIMKQQNNVFNLTVGQIITGIVGLLIGIGTFLLLKDSVNFNIIMWIIFLELIITVGIGVVKINGLNLFTFIILSMKIDKRPYCSKGVFNDESDELF